MSLARVLSRLRVEEAIALLQQYGDEAKVLAGGHSLIPAMKLRLLQPEHLIDIGRIDGLSFIREEQGAEGGFTRRCGKRAAPQYCCNDQRTGRFNLSACARATLYARANNLPPDQARECANGRDASRRAGSDAAPSGCLK